MNQAARLKKMVRLLLVALLAATSLGTLLLPLSRRVIVNQTPSLPRGIYWLTPVNSIRELGYGELVWIELPEQLETLMRQRRYIPSSPHAHLLKPVLGLPGDRWCIEQDSFLVRGHLIGPIFLHDTQQRPLPQLEPRCERLGPAQLLVGAAHPRSFDSRYVGPIPASAVRGRVTPVWTLSSPSRSSSPSPVTLPDASE